MNLTIVLVAAMLLVQTSTAPPDFSGTWKLVAARSESPLQSQPVHDITVSIQQGAEEIRIESTAAGERPIAASYPFVPVPKPSNEPLGIDVKRAYWDGSKLVLERGGTVSGQTVSLKETRTLNADHSEMTVERLVIVQHGYTLRGAKNYATVKDVFRRVP